MPNRERGVEEKHALSSPPFEISVGRCGHTEVVVEFPVHVAQ